jgi:hypothetical protein
VKFGRQGHRNRQEVMNMAKAGKGKASKGGKKGC